ncbi:MAG: hypothetical protein WCB58_22105 [Acidobacteriaceae bacterium]
MSKCAALGVTVGNLEGAIIHLQEKRTLHSLAGYQAALKLLEDELDTAVKAYLACMKR